MLPRPSADALVDRALRSIRRGPKQGGLRSDLVELIGHDAEILMGFAQFPAGALKGSAGLLAELQALPASEGVA
jgi:hypothetical protein